MALVLQKIGADAIMLSAITDGLAFHGGIGSQQGWLEKAKSLLS